MLNKVSPPKSVELQRQQQLFDITFDGMALGDGLLQMRHDAPFTTHFKKEYGEALSLARLLLCANLRPSHIESQTPPLPDMKVTFRDAVEQAVEVAAIVDDASAKRDGIREYLSNALRNAVTSNPALRRAIADKAVRIVFETFPAKGTDLDICANEIIGALKNKRMTALSNPVPLTFSKEYPKLHSVGAKCYYRKAQQVSITIGLVRSEATPQGMVDAFLRVVAKKQVKRYGTSASIWLALTLDDTEQIEADALAAIAQCLPNVELGQFSRILVGYERGIVVKPSFS